MLQALLRLYRQLDANRKELGLSWSEWERDARILRTLRSVDLGPDQDSLFDLVQSLRRMQRKLIGVSDTANEKDVVGIEVSANTTPDGEQSGEQIFSEIELKSGQTVFFGFKQE